MNYNWTPYAIGGATRPDSFSAMTPGMQEGLFGLLQAADAELGPGLQVYSGYRSPELQGELWAGALEKYGSPEAARKWVAPPGKSRHNTGQAADLKFNGVRIDQLPKDHPARSWLTANVAQYGLAQPMSWEPWQVEQAGARSTPSLSYGLPEPSGGTLGGFAPSMGEEVKPAGVMDVLGEVGAALSESAQQAPLEIAPVQARPYAPTRRDTSAPYLQLFQSLMG